MPVQVPSDFTAAKRELSAWLLAPEPGVVRAFAARRATVADPGRNVLGVGIGLKTVSGRTTGTLSIKLFVQMKQARVTLGESDLLPASVAGLPTDVEEVGLVLPLGGRMRPARPGCSVGFGRPDDPAAMAGTFGALVADAQGTYMLSNNHVLADENRLPMGEPISEPGPLDGGDPRRDAIALLCGYVPLEAKGDNEVDCAIALLRDGAGSADVLGAGPPAGVAEAALHAVVVKSGRTTGLTRGQVVSVDTDLKVPYDIGSLLFRDQIAIRSLDAQPFSMPGDSGALLMDDATGQGVGLLFAGSPAMSFANHLSDVLVALGVELVTG